MGGSRARCWLSLGIVLIGCACSTRAGTPAFQPLFSRTAWFESNLATQDWQRAYDESPPAWPQSDGATRAIEFILADLESGRRAQLNPAVVYSVDGRRRWGGRALDVSWVLVLDSVTGPVEAATLSIQLKADRVRFLQLEATLQRCPLEPQASGDPAKPVALEADGRGAESIPTPLGSYGERARSPYCVVEEPGAALLASVEPDEPRLFHFIDASSAHRFGVAFETCLSPETALFPGRAAFRFAFARWPATRDSSPTERAKEIHAALWPALTSSEAAPPSRSAPSAEEAWYPLVFAPRIRGSTATLHGAWAPLTLPQPAPPGDAALLQVEEALQAQSLEVLGNYARDARVRIEPSDTEEGHDAEALADGIVQVDWEQATAFGWRSTERATAHTIRLTLPKPTALTTLVLHWPVANQQPLSARALRVFGVTATGNTLLIAHADQLTPQPQTAIALPDVPLQQVILEMPAGGGPPEFSNRLWLCEMELR